MHILHYMAVQADDIESAYAEVESALMNDEGQSPADWSDWHVVGGGRWNVNEGEDWKVAYDDGRTNMIVSFAEQPDKFKEILDSVRDQRKVTMMSLMLQVNLETFKNHMTKFAEHGELSEDKDRFDMNTYYVRKASKLLSDYYSPDSYFYDLINYTPSLSYLYDMMSKPDEKDRLYLVPVDFHY